MHSQEQYQLGAALREMFAKFADHQRLREVVDGPLGWDEALWAQVRDFGLVGLAVAEERGGQGGSYTDLAVAFEEAGRVLACVPLLSASCAIALVDNCEGAAADELLSRLATGASRATAALATEAGWLPFAGVTLAGGRVSGTKHYVLDGCDADVMIVGCHVDGEPALAAARVDGAGIAVSSVESLDLTRPLATVEFRDAPVTLLARGDDAEKAVGRGLDVAAVLLAAEQMGGAQRCLDDAVAYAKIREQFGRPIGSFQAIKHKCADMLVAVEGARALAGDAARLLDENAWEAGESSLAARVAKAYCSDAFVTCAQHNLQIHGGIGFTWEHSAHLYLRRAKSAEVLFGSPAEHREAVVKAVHPR